MHRRIQTHTHKKNGFTLVEIMIVILIIILLTQFGNITSLFRQRDRGQLEDVAVQMLGVIDTEKLDALLGKTYKTPTNNSAIVRKRAIDIAINDDASITLSSKINLAEKPETTYETPTLVKSWNIPGLTETWYSCIPPGY